MNDFQKELRLDELNERAQKMDRAARMAIEWLKDAPTPEPMKAIKALSAWNQHQEKYWYVVIKMATEMVQEKNDE